MQYIIATHGKLADGYVNTIKVLTQMTNIHPICAYVDGDTFPENMQKLMSQWDISEPVLIFTDILGGSVTQMVVEMWGDRPNTHIIAGANLPLVLEVLCQGDNICESIIQDIIGVAQKQIVYVNALCEDSFNDHSVSD